MYTALSAERSDIRLLRVLPAQDESSQVACEYSSISLLDNPVYNALSYLWGDPTVTTPILVNGEVFHTTTNLAAALRLYTIDQGSPCPLATLNPFGRELLLSDVSTGFKRSTWIQRTI
jgi:Heterokaryon incompatibility protein (HET)